MIYLDDQLPLHRKILRAGSLIGEAAGGRCAALGLFVCAIAYSRQYLTDGVVPDEYLVATAGGRDVVAALHAAKLLDRLPEKRWRIHDYHAWNKPAAQVLKQRELNRKRQAKFRAKHHPNGQGVTRESRTHNAGVTGAPDPLSPIPYKRRKNTPADAVVFPQPVENSRPSTDVPSVRVLTAVARSVLSSHPNIRGEGDLEELVKRQAAKAHLRYTTRTVAVALARARAMKAKNDQQRVAG